MQINPIYSTNFNIYPKFNNKKSYVTNTLNNTDYSPAFYHPAFTGRVDKGMARFYEVNVFRMPRTVREYLESLPDKFSVSPLDAQRNAFEKLKDAVSIEDVKRSFPNEELFQDIESAVYTKATNGILGLYRMYQDIYENSPLKSKEEFTIYLLKKIFIESKTIDEINLDIESDLDADLLQEFKNKYKDSQYVVPSTLKSLGIKMPDVAYQNSLRFTREGYSDSFGLKISEAQLKYWNSLTEEQKFEILSKRLEGRDNWWNSLSYKEKLEYAAGIESEDELYHNYKKYVALQKRRKTYGDVGEEGSRLNNVQLTKKKIAVGSNLNHKDIFGLWMKNNLKNFYNRLSEADKDSVHIIRVRRLAVRWQSLTPEEKMEQINKIRADREPIRYAMIDAWNHSHNIIKELSKFLKEKQILKPVDMLYQDEGFSEFQSAIMTEFWATYPEFAVQLGENIKNAIERVQNSIDRGQFKDLKQEIERGRAYRKNLVKRELAVEEAKQKEQERLSSIPVDYNEEFIKLYKEKNYKDLPVPDSYINDTVSILLEYLTKDDVIKYTEALKNDVPLPIELMEKLRDIARKFTFDEDSKMTRNQRALEAAISAELLTKGTNAFEHLGDTLIMVLKNKLIHQESMKIRNKDKIDLARIERLYNEYKKDLPELELKSYVLNFFIPKSKENADIEKLKDFLGSFGRSLRILFSEQSAYSTEAKIAFKNKLYTIMPSDLKDKYIFMLETDERVKNEKLIRQIDKEIRTRFGLIDEKFVDYYLSELKKLCRYFEGSNDNFGKHFNPENYLKIMGLSRTRNANVLDIVPLPRHTLANADKLELLAMEQAMADELFKACNDEAVYNLSFETLHDLLMRAEYLKKLPKEQRKLYVEDSSLESGTKEFILNKPTNIRAVNGKYRDYIKNADVLYEIAEKEKRKIEIDDVVCWLNPEEGNELRDDIVAKRIEPYFTEYIK